MRADQAEMEGLSATLLCPLGGLTRADVRVSIEVGRSIVAGKGTDECSTLHLVVDVLECVGDEIFGYDDLRRALGVEVVWKRKVSSPEEDRESNQVTAIE